MLKIKNTLTRELEEFEPMNPGKVSFYHCGPTVYWNQHIGNLRGMTMADLIRRSLMYLGYEVNFVRNYTDVGHLTGDNIGDADSGEDRMEKAAKREQLDPQVIAQKYIDQFESDTNQLNILEPTDKPVASMYVEQMQRMIQILIEKDFAYITPRAVYFDISKAKDYTRLSGQKLSENEIGAGKGKVNDEGKKNPADFVLWFFKTGAHKDALQTWGSPFNSAEVENGEGLPGWHIECSAMANDLLGATIDIHMGGIEHIPVHHTNEIAQSESANGQKFVNYWIHNEHLQIDGGKMSKSEGTAFLLSDIIEHGFDPLALRYFFLQSHYRSLQNFTWTALEASANALNKIRAKVMEFNLVEVNHNNIVDRPKVLEYQQRFITALEDDFNIPQATAILWDVVKSKLDPHDKLVLIFEFDKVFGLDLEKVKSEPVPVDVAKLSDLRQKARENKDWQESDRLRDEIYSLGYVVEDTSEGQTLKPIQ